MLDEVERTHTSIIITWHRTDHPDHQPVNKFMHDLLAGPELFGCPDLVWVALLRLCTHLRIFVVPSPLEDLENFRTSVTRQRNYVPVVSRVGHFDVVHRLCRTHRAGGNLVNDAYLAAFSVDQSMTVVSLDHDFARFSAASWIDPSTSSS